MTSREHLARPWPQLFDEIPISEGKNPGRVSLVGAGPGAADLITVRGLRSLRNADAVLYDALLGTDLLAEARSDAVRISVGKRGYCIGSTRQERIHDVMVRLARAGMNVCRLKCGDPCVFGRGGEEAEFLAAHQIPFEIVPGVTSALGACAAAGIPLTHRDVGSSVTFVAGHHDPDSPEFSLDWPTLSQLPALVVYMAVRHWPRIAARLIEAGRAVGESVALIESATLVEQNVVVLTLGELAVRSAESLQGPALLVVGGIVAYRERLLPWLENPISDSLLAERRIETADRLESLEGVVV